MGFRTKRLSSTWTKNFNDAKTELHFCPKRSRRVKTNILASLITMNGVNNGNIFRIVICMIYR